MVFILELWSIAVIHFHCLFLEDIVFGRLWPSVQFLFLSAVFLVGRGLIVGFIVGSQLYLFMSYNLFGRFCLNGFSIGDLWMFFQVLFLCGFASFFLGFLCFGSLLVLCFRVVRCGNLTFCNYSFRSNCFNLNF
jgi:hypothetical protein